MTTSKSYITHMDRRLTDQSSGVSVAFGSGITTITIPYAVPTDGSKGVIALARSDTNARLVVASRPSTTTLTYAGNLTGVPLLIGLIYPYHYRLSRQYLRGEKGGTEQRGRLQIRYLNLDLAHTTDATVLVTADGRSGVSYVYSDPTAAEDALWRVPIMSRNTTVTIDILDSTPGALRIAAWDWEGEFTLRSRPA